MPISIPADLTIVTLSVRGVNQPQRFTQQTARTLLQQASIILYDRAQISFTVTSCEPPVVVEMPPNMRADVVDDSGFHFLVSQFRAGRGVRVIFVDRISRTDIGGRAREEKRTCIVPYDRDVPSTARKLAHELTHLLGISDHVNEGRVAGPGEEQLTAMWLRNLMYSGALNPAAELNADQIATMRSSALARQFGGGV